MFPDAMRRNLDLSGPLLLAEGVSAAVAPLLDGKDGRTGKQQLQDVVDQTLQAPPSDQAATYRKLLREAVPAAVVPGERLEELLDPGSYLGQAAQISRRILAAFPDFDSQTTDANGASRG